MYIRCLLFWLISYCFVYLSAYADCSPPQLLNVYNVTHQSASFNWSSNYYTSPPTYQLQWRTAGSANWNTNPVTTASLSLTGLANNTTYEWHVRSVCAAGDNSAYAIGTAFQTKCDQPTYLNVKGMYTVRAGFWNDPTVWSCNRLPTATDAVQLKHSIIVPPNSAIKVLTVNYDIGGQLGVVGGAVIQLGN